MEKELAEQSAADAADATHITSKSPFVLHVVTGKHHVFASTAGPRSPTALRLEWILTR
mgnify:CR=1 FL=1